MKLPYWMQYRLQEWKRRFPLVRRTTLWREVNAARRLGRQEVADSLKTERQTVERIIDRLAMTEFRREAGEYAVTVRFSGSLFGSYADDTRYVAQHVARQVEREIATSKFIKSADNYEMRRGPSRGVGEWWGDPR